MVVRIRLQRFGRKKAAHYRCVVVNSTAPRNGGRILDRVGWYNPIPFRNRVRGRGGKGGGGGRTGKGDAAVPPVEAGLKEVSLNVERIKYWMSCGAQPSDRVAWLLSAMRVLPPQPYRAFTKRHLPKKLRKEMEEAAEAAAAAAVKK